MRLGWLTGGKLKVLRSDRAEFYRSKFIKVKGRLHLISLTWNQAHRREFMKREATLFNPEEVSMKALFRVRVSSFTFPLTYPRVFDNARECADCV